MWGKSGRCGERRVDGKTSVASAGYKSLRLSQASHVKYDNLYLPMSWVVFELWKQDGVLFPRVTLATRIPGEGVFSIFVQRWCAVFVRVSFSPIFLEQSIKGRQFSGASCQSMLDGNFVSSGCCLLKFFVLEYVLGWFFESGIIWRQKFCSRVKTFSLWAHSRTDLGPGKECYLGDDSYFPFKCKFDFEIVWNCSRLQRAYDFGDNSSLIPYSQSLWSIMELSTTRIKVLQSGPRRGFMVPGSKRNMGPCQSELWKVS